MEHRPVEYYSLDLLKRRIANRRAQAKYWSKNREHVRRREAISDKKRDFVLGEVSSSFAAVCSYCGNRLSRESIHVDHFVPMKQGGTDDLENLVPACGSCNSSKGSKSFIVWLATRPRNNVERYLKKFSR